MIIIRAFCERVRVCVAQHGPDSPVTAGAKEQLRLVFQLLLATEEIQNAKESRAAQRAGESSGQATMGQQKTSLSQSKARQRALKTIRKGRSTRIGELKAHILELKYEAGLCH